MADPAIDHEDLYVIGDVHGCADELEELLALLPLSSESALVFTGDYIDRGPDSRRVLDTVLKLRESRQVHALLGNHEELLLRYLDDRTALNGARFIYNGGGATLQSYGPGFRVDKLPDEHIAFVRSLPLLLESPGHVFVHAGVPDVPLDEIDFAEHRTVLLWVRGDFHKSEFRWAKTIVHGHSCVPEVRIGARRVNVDTGCVYGGTLSCFHVATGRVFSVPRKTVPQHEFLKDPPPSRRIAARFGGRVEVRFTQPAGLPTFHTIDYSNFGALLECEGQEAAYAMGIGQDVEGVLLPNDDRGRVEFAGKVVRRERTPAKHRYAVKFAKPATIESPKDSVAP